MSVIHKMKSMTSDDESNVVGTLFALNGEDDGYNPEDWVQDVTIDEKTSFRVSVAEDDGSIPGTLFACAIWNGARFIARHFTAHPAIVEGKSVVEFGAASALPSLAALHFGAEIALITDYPNDFVLANIRQNVARNQAMLGDGQAVVRGHLWGSSTDDLLECLKVGGVENQPRRFDVAVVAECLWLHHLHVDLLRSIHACLADGGKAYVSFAHHVPGHEQNDLSFFEKAKTLFGFQVEYLDTLAAPHLFSPEKLVDQYLYCLTKSEVADQQSA